jgi:hypothetical protein
VFVSLLVGFLILRLIMAYVPLLFLGTE